MASDTNVGYASIQVIPTIRGVGAELTRAIGGPLEASARQAGRRSGEAIADGIANAEGRVRQASDKIARAREAETTAAAKVAIEEAKLQELRDRGITGGSRWLAQAERVRQAQQRQAAAARGTETATENLERAQRELNDANQETEDGARGAGGALSGLASKAKEALTSVKGLALAGGGIGAALMGGMSQAMSQEAVTDKLAASLGATGALAKEYGDTAGKLYAAGYGESFEQIAEATGIVASSFQTLGFEGEVSLEKATERAQNFASTFGTDVSESVQTVSTLMSTGLVSSTTEGFDLMTAAFQRVPAAMRDELPEILHEYGVNFKALGFTGEESFSLLVQAAEKGKFALDKTGDALKEFTIRGSDMSAGSTAAYQAIGLNAEEMSRKVAAGGAGAQDALQKTAQGLLKISDPAERANAAIALFGTPLEDLSVDQIPAFLEGLTGSQNAMDGFAGATDRMGDTLNDNGAVKLETFKRTLQQGFVKTLEGAALWISKNAGLIKDLGVAAGLAAVGVGALVLQQKIMAAGGVISFIRTMVNMTKAWAAQQVILNAVMSLNPIGAVILAVTALVAAVVIAYRNSETFRNIVQGAWNGIKTAVGAVWNWLSTTVFPFFQAALKKIGEVAMWLWNNAIMPAFNGIKTVIGLWWTGVQIYFNAWKTAVNWVGQAAMWLWNNVITPAFNGIKFAVQLAWAAIQIVFQLLKAGIEGVGIVVNWLWQNVVSPAFNGIGSIIGSVWGGVIMPVFNAFKAGIDVIGKAGLWLWNEVMIPAWNGIKSAIESVWNFIRPVLDNIGKGIQAVGTIATRVGDAMRNAFDGVVDVLKAPIHAIGRLMASLPGKIMNVDIPGVSTLKAWGETLQSLRTGGVIAGRSKKGMLFGPGTGVSDSLYGVDESGMPIVRVSAGEGIVNKKAMDNGGEAVVAALNAGWRPAGGSGVLDGLPAFKTGGVIGSYGMPNGTSISYGAPGFPDWVYKLGEEHGVKPSTYPGHQESDRNEPGYAPNPSRLNRGIDWSGSVAALHKFAEFLLSAAPSTESLEQIIWQNPGTGQKIGWHGRSMDDGSYFASDYGGHQDHVHTRHNGPMGPAAAPPKPDTKTEVPGYAPPELTDTTTTTTTTTDTSTVSPSTTAPVTPDVSGDMKKARLKTFRELGADVGGILAGGIEETFDGLVPAWVWDPNKLMEGDDGSNVRTSDGATAGNETIKKDTPVEVQPDGSLKPVDPSKALPVPDPVEPKAKGPGNRKGAAMYAYEIARAGLDAKVGKAGAKIGLATALVESGNPLKMWANKAVPESLNFPHDAVGSDYDSVGLFQQRDNGAWGTVADRMDPYRSAGMFYRGLKGVPGWETMDPGAAAQAVQRSAFPDKYGQQMGAAEALLAGTGLFDTGGILQPGTFAYNGLNEPELVLKKHQWGVMARNAEVVEAQARGGGDNGGKIADVLNIQGYTIEEVSTEWRKQQWSRTAGYGTSRHR